MDKTGKIGTPSAVEYLGSHPDKPGSGIGPPSSTDVVEIVMERAQQHFRNANGSHDWEHTLRVLRLCERIGPVEQADMTALRIAAALHDIGRCLQDRSNGAVCHAEIGAKMAGDFLRDLLLPDGLKSIIISAVRSHRFRGNLVPETVEAKVLFDADKIDAIGAVGIARAYLFAGELGARLHNPGHAIHNAKAYSRDDTGYREYKVKLCKIKDRMLTGEGKQIAAERHAFMVDFFDRFLNEYEGRL